MKGDVLLFRGSAAGPRGSYDIRSLRAELQRRDSDQPAEDLCEVALVCESGCLCHLADGELGAAQKFLGAIDPAPQRVLVGADARALLEELAEIVRAHPRQMRQFPQARFLSIILSHEIQYASESDSGHAVSVYGVTRRSHRVAPDKVVGERDTQ